MTKSSSAEEIRGHVLKKYIEPARRRGATEIAIRSGDVHSDLGYSGKAPNVCQSMRGEKLEELASIKLIDGGDEADGLNVLFRYHILPLKNPIVNSEDYSSVPFLIKSSISELFGQDSIELSEEKWVGREITLPKFIVGDAALFEFNDKPLSAFIWLHEKPKQGAPGTGLTAEVLLGGSIKDRAAKIKEVSFFRTMITGSEMFDRHAGTNNILGQINAMRLTRMWLLSPADAGLLLDEIEHKADKIAELNPAVSPFDRANLEPNAVEFTLQKIQLRRHQARFKAKLIGQYGHKCILTASEQAEVIEAAHIVPYRLGLPNRDFIGNGLLLRSDIHKLFDKFLISFTSDKKAICTSKALLESYHFLKDLPVPDTVNPENANWHHQEFLRLETLRDSWQCH